MNVMGVVLAQHRHLFVRQRHAHGEWQVFHAVEAHVELQCLERGHLRLVVEVVDLEQVDLVDEPIGREDGVGELVLVVARLDDLHRLLVQVGMGRLALHLAEQVQHRVVEACVVEADHLCADAAQPEQPEPQLGAVISPRADLERPTQRHVGVLCRQREAVGVCLDVVDYSHLIVPNSASTSGWQWCWISTPSSLYSWSRQPLSVSTQNTSWLEQRLHMTSKSGSSPNGSGQSHQSSK